MFYETSSFSGHNFFCLCLNVAISSEAFSGNINRTKRDSSLNNIEILEPLITRPELSDIDHQNSDTLLNRINPGEKIFSSENVTDLITKLPGVSQKSRRQKKPKLLPTAAKYSA